MLSKFMEFSNKCIEKKQLMLTDNDIDATCIGNSFYKVYASTISTTIRSFQYRLLHMIMQNF